MKKPISRIVCIAALTLLSCSPNEEWGVVKVTLPSISLQAPSVWFDHSGGAGTFIVEFSNVTSWQVSGDNSEWLSVSPVNGGDDSSVTFNLLAGQSYADSTRSAKIIITVAGGVSGTATETASFKVRQTPDPAVADITSYDLNKLFLVQNNGDTHDNGTISMTYKICSSPGMNPLPDGYGGYTFSDEGYFLSFDLNVSSLDGNGLPPAGVYNISLGEESAEEFTFDYGYYHDAGYYGWNCGTFFGTVNTAGTVIRTQFISDGTVTLVREGTAYTITAYVFDEYDNEFVCTYSGKLEVFDGYGTVERDQTVTSSVMIPGSTVSVKYSVILPDGYASSRQYPVLYLLHGYGGNNNSWLDDGNARLLTSNAIADRIVQKFIVVMPDGYNAFYCNGLQDNYQYMTFFFNEFIPYIESHYSINTDMRSVAGLSMGGFGTLYYSLLSPSMFDLGYAMSPALGSFGGIDLFSMASTAGSGGDPLPRIVVACGTADYVVYNETTFSNFDNTLENAGFSHQLVLDDGYSHAWDYWQLCYKRVMTELGKIW